MTKYIVTAVELVRLLKLDDTDENIIKYTQIVKNKYIAEKAVEEWAASFGKEINGNSSDN